MPELPEVETIVRGLAPLLRGRIIQDVVLRQEKVVARPTPEDFIRGLVGHRIEKLGRRGKFILIHLDQGMVLVVHLRMTGQLVFQNQDAPLPRHTHAVWLLDQGILRFTDPRRFGRLWLLPEMDLGRIRGLAGLGVEPLHAAFTEHTFRNMLSKRRARIKALLLDQRFIAGLGNIYTDEALHRAGIHPDRHASELTAGEVGALYGAVREVLTEGITHGGTSVRDYVDASGAEGGFQEKLRVYGRAGRPCLRCGQPVVRTVCAGRGTYYCPRCQKE